MAQFGPLQSSSGRQALANHDASTFHTPSSTLYKIHYKLHIENYFRNVVCTCLAIFRDIRGSRPTKCPGLHSHIMSGVAPLKNNMEAPEGIMGMPLEG